MKIYSPMLLAAVVVLLSGCATPFPARMQNENESSLIDVKSATLGFNGKTLLIYEEDRGNQIEYYGQDGRSYRWAPGNQRVVVGLWKLSVPHQICFNYATSTDNSVTDEANGKWDCKSLRPWSVRIVDTQVGDRFNLSSGKVPFVLPVEPKIVALNAVKAAQ